MRTALRALHQGLYNSLTQHQPLMDKITAVLDDVQEGQAFPYATVGEPTVSPFDTKTSTGEEIVWVLHCWSQYQGKAEAYDILNLMNEAFMQQPLSLDDGFFIADFRRDQMQVITDIDNETRHGILRVRVWVGQS